MLLTLAFLFACVPPFEHGRHDLVDLRIVAMAYEAGVARAFVWEGEQAWSAVAPSQIWTGDRLSELCPSDSDCAPRTDSLVASVVVASGTASESGTLTVDPSAVTPIIGNVRVEWAENVATITLDAPESHTSRWMSPTGTLAETDTHTVEFQPDDDTLVPLVALTNDDLGGNAWTVIDLASPGRETGLQVGNRLLPVTTSPVVVQAGERGWLATLTAAETVYGFALDDLVADDGSLAAEGCGIEHGYWNPNRIIDRSCGLDDIVGLTVPIFGTFVP